jgi:hypothetical protein
MWGDGGNLGPYSLWMWGCGLTQTCISGLLFLEPKDIQSISLGAVWSFSKASGLPWLDMGQKGPALRPRCNGAVRSRTLDILIQDEVKIMSEVSTEKDRLRFKAGDEVENFSDNVRAVELRITQFEEKINSEILKKKDQILVGSLTSNRSAIVAEVGRDSAASIAVYISCYLCSSMYCLCVNVYCHQLTTQLQLANISYHIRCRSNHPHMYWCRAT